MNIDNNFKDQEMKEHIIRTRNQEVQISQYLVQDHMPNIELCHLSQMIDDLDFESLLNKDQLESARSVLRKYIGCIL